MLAGGADHLAHPASDDVWYASRQCGSRQPVVGAVEDPVAQRMGATEGRSIARNRRMGDDGVELRFDDQRIAP